MNPTVPSNTDSNPKNPSVVAAAIVMAIQKFVNSRSLQDQLPTVVAISQHIDTRYLKTFSTMTPWSAIDYGDVEKAEQLKGLASEIDRELGLCDITTRRECLAMCRERISMEEKRLTRLAHFQDYRVPVRNTPGLNHF